jgi:glycosyltransferase involved in cell wall biosynthesis
MAVIKLLHLVNNFEDESNNRLVLNLVKGLSSGQYSFHVGCIESAGGPLESEFMWAGAATINFGMRNYFDLGVICRLRSYIERKGIDIVHTHILKADLLAGLALHFGRGATLIATKHNLSFLREHPGWLWRNLLYRLALFFPDLLIAVSDAMKDYLITVYKLHPSRVVRIYNGINVRSFGRSRIKSSGGVSLRTEYDLSSDDFVVGFIGRLVNGKGLIDLLQAMRIVVSFHRRSYLAIAGRGPLLSLLKRKARDLGIGDNVIFLGYRSDISDILAQIDALALPSLSEGLPLSVLEAMAAGKAVVATPVGGVKELIKSGETGLLVAPKNPSALADAILLLLNNNGQRKNLGLKAKAFIEHKFDTQLMLDQYDSIYQSLMWSKVSKT